MSFDNCGQKIKTLAKILRWVSIVAGAVLFIAGLVQSCSGSSYISATGTVMLISGLSLVFIGWIGSLLLYGFGIIVAANEGFSDTPAKPAAQHAAPQTPAASPWKCSHCGTENPQHLSVCRHCDEAKPSKFTVSASSSAEAATTGWRCSHCGTNNSKYVSNCLKCGSPKAHA